MKFLTLMPALFLWIVALPASAQDCLSKVRDFSLSICGEIERSGARTIVTGDGKLDASVSTIIRRIVGGGAAGVSGSVLSDTYENVAREELGKDRFNARECRERMVAVAVSQVCNSKSSAGSSSTAVSSQPAPPAFATKMVDGISFRVTAVRKSANGGTIISLDVSSPVRLAYQAHGTLLNGENEHVSVRGIPECSKQNLEECPSQVPLGTWFQEGVIGFSFSKWYPPKGTLLRLSFHLIRANDWSIIRVALPPVQVP